MTSSCESDANPRPGGGVGVPVARVPLPSHFPKDRMPRSALSLLTLTLSLSLTQAADWPQFRGPGGSGVADDQKPPTKFGPNQNLAWKVPVPPGASSPIVVGDRIFLTAFEDGKLFTIGY